MRILETVFFLLLRKGIGRFRICSSRYTCLQAISPNDVSFRGWLQYEWLWSSVNHFRAQDTDAAVISWNYIST